MNRSTASLKARQRERERKRKRRRIIRNRIYGVIVLTVLVFLSVIGVRSGLEMSRNMKYPVEYSEYIIKYAKQNDLDPYLVIAVIKQESNFVADARSPYAGGLMQLTEDTANDYAKKLGMTDFDYMEPETNIRIGCYVLSSLIQKYRYTDTALAAYNAGMGNVDAWLSDSRYSSDGKTLDHIPYAETRHYVKKINAYMHDYREKIDIE